MGTITENQNAEWAEDIYLIETTDLVEGGEDGVSNKQAIQLAERTQYLKKQIAEMPEDGSVTTAKIADKAITADKLAEGVGQLPKVGPHGVPFNGSQTSNHPVNSLLVVVEGNLKGTLVRRTAWGNIFINDPAKPNHAATKNYVDGQISALTQIDSTTLEKLNKVISLIEDGTIRDVNGEKIIL